MLRGSERKLSKRYLQTHIYSSITYHSQMIKATQMPINGKWFPKNVIFLCLYFCGTVGFFPTFYLLKVMVSTELSLWLWSELKSCFCRNWRKKWEERWQNERIIAFLSLYLWMHEICSLYITKKLNVILIKHHSTLKREEILKYTTTWINLENVAWSKTTRHKKKKFFVFVFLYYDVTYRKELEYPNSESRWLVSKDSRERKQGLIV